MWSNEKNLPSRSRGCFTPQPPAWKKSQSSVLPMSERKRISPAGYGDSFHVIHKVPASDSPYGRAKHVQLIDKDPSKAISLFWAAINAGDRVDSALKDMAVVMKQLNRSDEAIEAIKSFRHLCPHDSQESLDNVLVELYKRSGRVEEEIEMLHIKLRNIEEGIVFGGKRTKIARSQGKKIQITIEQEKSRILGNLAWAYLQQHNYGIAEQHYRKALALEPDKNKQCNLAICLMHMNRISEARSLLQDVKDSSGNEEMDESYAKSYERALEMLVQAESQSMLRPVAKEPDKGRDRSLKEAGIFLPRDEDNNSLFMDKKRLPYSPLAGKKDNRSSKCTPIGLKCDLQSSPQIMFTQKWEKGSNLESLGEGSAYSSKLKENWGSAHKKIYASSAASEKDSESLFTQPKRCSWGFNNTDQRRGGRWREDTVRNSIRKLSFEQTLTSESEPSLSIQNLKDNPQASNDGKSENSAVLLTQPRNSVLWLNIDQRRDIWAEESVSCPFRKLSFEKNINGVTPHSGHSRNGEPSFSSRDEGLEKPTNASNKKSWADMVEEEEEEKEELLNREEEFNDENLNSNIICQYPDRKGRIGNITQQLESLDMKGGENVSANDVSSRRNRLQVFRDITSSPSSTHCTL